MAIDAVAGINPYAAECSYPLSCPLGAQQILLPPYTEHHAVQTAADAQKTHKISRFQDTPLCCQGGGDRQGHGSDVAQVLEGGKIFILGDADGT